jgi:hypothetical protein
MSMGPPRDTITSAAEIVDATVLTTWVVIGEHVGAGDRFFGADVRRSVQRPEDLELLDEMLASAADRLTAHGVPIRYVTGVHANGHVWRHAFITRDLHAVRELLAAVGLRAAVVGPFEDLDPREGAA